jgi:hypothetical protein
MQAKATVRDERQKAEHHAEGKSWRPRRKRSMISKRRNARGLKKAAGGGGGMGKRKEGKEAKDNRQTENTSGKRQKGTRNARLADTNTFKHYLKVSSR